MKMISTAPAGTPVLVTEPGAKPVPGALSGHVLQPGDDRVAVRINSGAVILYAAVHVAAAETGDVIG